MLEQVFWPPDCVIEQVQRVPKILQLQQSEKQSLCQIIPVLHMCSNGFRFLDIARWGLWITSYQADQHTELESYNS